jgi:Ca-activated chloride channel family protein
MRGPLAAVLLLALAGWEPFRAPNPHVEQGNKALADGRIDDALSAYDAAAHDGDVDPTGLAYDRGSARLKKAQAAKDPAEKAKLTESALEDLKQAATSHDPRIRSQSHYNRGNTLLAQDKLDDAIESYKQALREQPSLDDARLNLELALKRRQKHEQQQQQQGGQGQQGQGQQGQGQQGQPQQGQGQPQQGQGQPQQGQGQPQQGQGQQQPQQGQGQQGQQGKPGQGQDQQGQPGGDSQDPKDDPKNDPKQGQGNQQQGQPGQKRPGRGQPQGPKTPSDGKLDDLEDFSRNLQRDGARRKASGRPRDPDKDW